MSDPLARSFPQLARRLPKTAFAELPTPVSQMRLPTARGTRTIAIKHDDICGAQYGGNKVRKLEYLLRHVHERGARRVATFGTVASNHALATALYATSLDIDCTCLLSHQTRTPACARALKLHLQSSTEIIRFGGNREARVKTMRRHLQGRKLALIPAGGSNWIGAMGFVSAAQELAEQIDRDELPTPDRLYVASGTMGTAAGLALGLALAGLPTEVHAIRVTHDFVANPPAMRRLIAKTAALMQRLDTTIPADLADRVRLNFRDGFFAGGYARTNEITDRAIDVARDELGLELEATYTGKAMAALLHDIDLADRGRQAVLFWNTYNSRQLPVTADRPEDVSGLPQEFLRYFD